MLGSGGMGQVYLARSAEHGSVALKVVFAAPDTALAHRFRREASALVELDIDGCVRGLDWGQDEQLSWLAMEWVRGPSLARVLEDGRAIDPDEAARIVAAVARTLGRVHRAGLAHRDIKPSNILLRPDGTPLLADFGILRHLDDTPRTALTQRPIGTPAYMAPELLKTDDVDWKRADLYALGVVFARCLLGRVPHGDWDIDAVDPRWQPILRSCLSTRPSDRPESADAFAEVLEGGGHRPRRPAWVPIALGAAVLLSFLAGVAWVQGPTDASVRAEAEAAFGAVSALIEAGRVDDADRVFEAALEGQSAAVVDALWRLRAEQIGSPGSWAEAWENTRGSGLRAVRHGLERALLDAGDMAALDMLLAGDADPDPAVWTANAVFHRRFDVLQDAPADALHPGHRALVDVLSQLRPLDEVASMGPRVGLPASGPGSLLERDGVQMLDTMPPLARVQDTLSDLDGRACPLPPDFRWAQWWNGQIAAITAGGDRSLYVIDPDTCAQREHPVVQTLDFAYINAVIAWDIDGDATDELALLVGPPYGYEVVVVGETGVLTRLTMGNVVGAAVLPTDASPTGSDLVVRVDPPHANGVVFDLQPPGVYRLRWTGTALEVVQSWDGSWPHMWTAQMLPDAPAVLALGNWTTMDLVVPDQPDVPPLRVDVLDWHSRPVDLDDDGDVEHLVLKDDTWWVLGMAADAGGEHLGALANPMPEPPEPTGDPAIDAARRLEGLGLPALAAERLGLASLGRVGADAHRSWAEVARLWLAADALERAADAWLEAADAGYAAGRRDALELLVRIGAIDRARALVAEADDETLDARIVRSLDGIDADFSQAPDAWALRAPLATWSADPGRLRFRSVGPAGVLAELGVRDSGMPARGFALDLTIERLEFGAEWTLHLMSAERSVAQATIRALGGRGDIRRNVAPHPYPVESWEGDDPTAKDRVRVTFSGFGDEGWFAVQRGDELVYRNRMELGPSSELLVERVQIRSTGLDGAMLDVSIEALSLWGMELGEPVALPPADERMNTAIRRTRLRTGSGLERLVPGDPRLLDLLVSTDLSWRMHRSASGVQDRLLSIPGVDDPAVLETAPLLALDRAEMLLAVGEPRAALDALEAIPVQDRDDLCVRHHAARWAVHRALDDADGQRAAREAASACGAGDKAVATALWWAGGEATDLGEGG
jgi:hypothetical protein